VSKRTGIAIAVIVLGGIAWYAFRPERLFVNQKVNESLPTTQAASTSTPVAWGMFHDGAHKTSGNAAVYQGQDGKRILRLSEFETSNGPDVQVYLVKANDSKPEAAVRKGDFVNVGALKGNIGDQNYEIPANVELSKYDSVTVWCRRFGVNFGSATLKPAGQATTALMR
jgi:hypothetical protein